MADSHPHPVFLRVFAHYLALLPRLFFSCRGEGYSPAALSYLDSYLPITHLGTLPDVFGLFITISVKREKTVLCPRLSFTWLVFLDSPQQCFTYEVRKHFS